MSKVKQTLTYTELKQELEKTVAAIESESIKIDDLIPLLKQADSIVKACEVKLRGLQDQATEE